MATCEYILYGDCSQFSFLYHLSPEIHLLCMCYKVPSVFIPLRGGGGGGGGGLNILQLQTDYIIASLPCMEHSVM